MNDSCTLVPANWKQVYASLGVAHEHAYIGTSVPPMERFHGLHRYVARLAGRLVLYLSRVVTNGQRQFNLSLLESVQGLGERLRLLENANQGLAEKLQNTNQACEHALSRNLALEQANQALLQRLGFVESLSLPSGEPVFRPGTMDAEIWYHVVNANEYRLPDVFPSEDIIIDIGAHIGSFSSAVLSRGAGCIHAYEANWQNFYLLERNLRRFEGRTSLNRKAVWRSDRAADFLHFAGNTTADGWNTGGGSVIYPEGEPVPSIRFDDLVVEATDNGRRRVRLVKIDCEGSEWPILFTSRRLDLVEGMCGEYHELRDSQIPEGARVDGFTSYDSEALKDYLESKGFLVELQPTVPGVLGLFWARRSLAPLGTHD
jgi:FkbM family methyltransferase